MSLTQVLAAVAPNVNNNVLGQVAKAFDADALGSALRPLLGSFEPTVTAAAVSGNVKSSELPESSVARTALVETVFNAFNNHRRRSVTALSRLTGLTSEAVLELILNESNLEVCQGQNDTMVRCVS